MRTRSLLPARFVWTPGSLTSDNGSPKYNSLITWLKSYLKGFYWFRFDPKRSLESFPRPNPDQHQETLNRTLVETEWVEIWKFPGTLFTLNCPPNLQPRFSFIGSRIKFLTGDYPNDRFVNNIWAVTWRSHDVEYSKNYWRVFVQDGRFARSPILRNIQ